MFMARQTKLTPALQTAIVNAVTAGVSLAVAAELGGIDTATVYEWYARGIGQHTRHSTPVYAAFAEAIMRARAHDETRRIARIEQAGRGGAVIARKTTRLPDGRQITEERFAPPDWQADAWHLERSRPKEWGRKDRVNLTVTIQEMATKVAAELGITVEEVLLEAQHLLTETQ
jgi:hypothetical protein